MLSIPYFQVSWIIYLTVLMTSVTAERSFSTMRRITSSSAVAEKPRCRMGQFWVGDGWWHGSDNTLHQTCGARKLKALVFHTINPLLYDKRSLWVLSLSLGGLWAKYAVNLRLIGKTIVAFLLVIIELFSLDAIVQALRAIIDWKSPFLKGVGNFRRKFQVEGTSPTNHLCTVR